MFILMLLAAIGAIGVAVILLSIKWEPKRDLATDIEKIQGLAGAVEGKKRAGVVERWLAQTSLDIPVSQFLPFAALWAAGGAVALWFTTGGYTIMPIVGAFAGVFLYVRWLAARRDDHLVRYEEAIADLADRLAIAAATKGSLGETLRAAVPILPEIIRPDIQEVVDRINKGEDALSALDGLRKKRRFVMMEILVKSLTEWQIRAKGLISLSDVLQPLSDSLRRIAFNRAQETSKLGRARNTARLAAVAPALMVLLFRTLNPSISRFFETIDGELLLTLSAVISLGIYWLCERWLSQHRETVKFGA